MSKKLVITIVGDGTVGKTCLLNRFVYNEVPNSEDYEPTVFENYSKTVNIEDKVYEIKLWDTAGQEGYDKLRAVAHINTDVFLVCYTLDKNRNKTLDNCKTIWVPEISEYKKHNKVTFLLIGTKMDLAKTIRDEEMIGRTAARDLKAFKFVMTSSVTGDGVEEAIREAIMASEYVRKKCVIL